MLSLSQYLTRTHLRTHTPSEGPCTRLKLTSQEAPRASLPLPAGAVKTHPEARAHPQGGLRARDEAVRRVPLPIQPPISLHTLLRASRSRQAHKMEGAWVCVCVCGGQVNPVSPAFSTYTETTRVSARAKEEGRHMFFTCCVVHKIKMTPSEPGLTGLFCLPCELRG